MAGPVSNRSKDSDITQLLLSSSDDVELSLEEQKTITGVIKAFLSKSPTISIVSIDTSLLDRVTVSYKDRGDKSIRTAELFLYPKL